MKFSVDMQPTEEMLKAGIDQLIYYIPGIEDEVDEEQLSDAVYFIWQAMIQASK
ncbi:TPA: hypothetical protein JTC92_004391 [Escherichia coli]|nr:MAG: hypothetical protein [Bacteriophage sp.]HAX8749156.1 hypothetical protein [Escherichia coli]